MEALRGAVALSMTLVVGVGATVPARQPASPSVADGIYTTAQADRGQVLYEEQCVRCHGAVTQVTPEMAALLADHTFRARWRGRSLGELFEVIQVTMPQDDLGSLSSSQTTDLVAYILSGNRRPPGDVALTDDVEALTEIPFDPQP